MRSDKKVLILSPRPNWGGASQVVLNLLAEVRTDTTQLQFIFLFEETGPAIPEFQQFGSVFIFPIEKHPLFRKIVRRVSSAAYNILKYWYAKWVIKTQKPQLLYVNSLTQNPSVRAALSSNVPLVLHAHEMDFLVAMRLPEAYVHNVLNRAKQLITCAKAVATFYEKTYSYSSEKISVLHGPVSWKRLAANSPNREFGSTSEPTGIVVGVVANISYLKAPDLLVEAFWLVKKHYSKTAKIKLNWLGAPNTPTPYFTSVLKLVKARKLEDDVCFLPASSQTSSFYQTIDLFVLPSRTEAFPLSILEAMLFEKPVVAMDVGGIREVVDHQTGYLVKDRTPEGLAEGILYFLESEERRLQAGKAGQQRVLEHFEAREQAPKWLALLQK
jgi:glycosyltransferase involved in cell wall biosynthesis